MEIFITLTKYNTRQQREEGQPMLVVNYWSAPSPLTIVSNVFMRNGTHPLMFPGKVCNTYIVLKLPRDPHAILVFIGHGLHQCIACFPVISLLILSPVGCTCQQHPPGLSQVKVIYYTFSHAFH